MFGDQLAHMQAVQLWGALPQPWLSLLGRHRTFQSMVGDEKLSCLRKHHITSAVLSVLVKPFVR